MSMSFKLEFCDVCKAETVHERVGDAPGHFCVRHQGQVLKAYVDQADRMRAAILAARASVQDFPSWRAVRERN